MIIGQNMEILEIDRAHSVYEDRSRYKTFDTKISPDGQN